MITFTTPGVGIYTRKSSNKQGELSLPAQERICRKVIVEPLDLPVYRVYKDILSGQRPDRTDYQEMLADARSGKLRMVVFHKVNRFGRDAAEGLTAIQELRKLGVEIRIADLPTLDLRKPEGMFIFTFLLGQGQYEVENLGNEARKGMQEKVEQGGWPFLAPDGYQNCREEIGRRKFRSWIAVDRHRAAVVRLMFLWYKRGDTTLQGVVRRLSQLHNQREARGKSGCLRRSGKRWNAQTVHHMLTNRFYAGEIAVEGWGPARLERAQMVKTMHKALLAEAIADLRAFAQWADVLPKKQHQVIARMIRQVDINTAGSVTNVVWQLLWDLLWFTPQGPTMA